MHAFCYAVLDVHPKALPLVWGLKSDFVWFGLVSELLQNSDVLTRV